VRLTGHAVEARISAEDPARGFLPTGGTVLALREPSCEHVRVDSGLAAGMTIGSAYDPMLAKVIAFGDDRDTALRRLDAALSSTMVLGVTTNIAFLRTLLADPQVAAGRLDTGLAERVADVPVEHVPSGVLAAAALADLLTRADSGAGPWDIRDGWRVGEHAWTTLRLTTGPAAAPVPVRVRGLAGAAQVAVGDGPPSAARARLDNGTLVVTWEDRTERYDCARCEEVIWLGRDGQSFAIREEEPLAPERGSAQTGDGVIRSPMPGTVRAVQVAVGEKVRAGQPLLIVEAMKMEHSLAAPTDGEVRELLVAPGQQVGLDERLAVVEALTPKE
jgi:acetyl-CoA/propionyl-CoA carboxylase biotin carboxyl carrier protein